MSIEVLNGASGGGYQPYGYRRRPYRRPRRSKKKKASKKAVNARKANAALLKGYRALVYKSIKVGCCVTAFGRDRMSKGKKGQKLQDALALNQMSIKEASGLPSFGPENNVIKGDMG